jgi:hypothetical protein
LLHIKDEEEAAVDAINAFLSSNTSDLLILILASGLLSSC